MEALKNFQCLPIRTTKLFEQSEFFVVPASTENFSFHCAALAAGPFCLLFGPAKSKKREAKVYSKR